MKLNFIHACDYATISKEGKLSVMGMFAQLGVTALPATHPMMYLVFEIEISKVELGRDLGIEVQLVDQDGTKVFAANASVKVQRNPAQPSALPITLPQVLGLAGLEFKREGEHSFNVFLNGNLAGGSMFRVTKGPQPGTPAKGQPEVPK